MLDTETGPGTIEEADAVLTTVTEEPAAPAAEAAPAPAAQPRDDQGRFSSPPQAEASAPEAGAPLPAPEPSGEPQAATEPPVEDSEPDVPFVYRAEGQELSIPGSAVGPDGVFLPQAFVPQLQQLLAEGHAARGSVRQRLSEAATREQAANQRVVAAEAQVQTVLGHFENLIQTGQLGDWLANVQQNWPVLVAQAQAKATEMKNEADRKLLDEYRQREQEQRLRPVMQQTLRGAVQRFGAQAGLDAAAQAEVERQLVAPEFEAMLFPRAPYDDPQNGIRQGDRVIDYTVVQRAIGLASVGRPATRAQPVAAQRPVAPVAPAARVPVPPTVGKGSQAPVPKGYPTFTSAKEADEWLQHGELPEPED